MESDEGERRRAANYRGIRKRKWGKWVSEIRLPNSRQRIWLGSYDSPEKAALAFDAALFCLRGNNANFNFPHQPPNIPGGTDLHPSQIQAAAAHYANSVVVSPVPEPPSTLESDHASSSIGLHTNSIPDYGIFPGFDDYFMQPPMLDYEEEEVVVDDSQADTSFLWNF